MPELGEGSDLGVTFGAIGQKRDQLSGNVLGGEVVLKELRDDAAASWRDRTRT